MSVAFGVHPDSNSTLARKISAAFASRIAVERQEHSRRRGWTRWRGKIPIPASAHPIVRRLIQEANSQSMMLKEIAVRAGLQPDTISEWRYRRSPYLPNVVAALNVLGFTLAVVPLREKDEALDKRMEQGGCP